MKASEIGAEKGPGLWKRERTCGAMTKTITSFLDDLRQIFGMVYSEAPTESIEESEENED